MKKLFKVFLVMGIVMAELCFAAEMNDRAPEITGVGGPKGPILEGTQAVFFVNVNASPKALGVWYRNGHFIVPADNIRFTSDEKGNFTMTWSDLYLEDSGEIMFIAINDLGTASARFRLEVYTKEE